MLTWLTTETVRLVNYAIALVMAMLLLGCRPNNDATMATGATNTMRSGSSNTNLPVTLRYVGNASSAAPITPAECPQLKIYSGRVFWVTNHTTNMVSVSMQVETQQSSGWVTWDANAQGKSPQTRHQLVFKRPPQIVNNGTVSFRLKEEFVLAPGQSGYGTPRFSERWTIPTGTVWRVKTLVQEQASGFQEMISVARNYPGILNQRLRSDATNLHLNPKSMKWFGQPIECGGPQVTEQ
ncbi:MAG: hypothetical protein JWM68_5104 [Verrucomicrobiales bacterium]|nr:hypothetical protein [Verrucomicrobiales bacterium]